VGELRAGRPDFLTVHDEVIARVHRARPERREVGAGAGFRETLAPDILAGQDARQEMPLLLFGSPFDEDGSGHADAGVSGQDRRSGAEAFLVVDDLLHERGAAPTVLLGPRDADPAGLVHRPLPDDTPLERRAIGSDSLVDRIVDAE